MDTRYGGRVDSEDQRNPNQGIVRVARFFLLIICGQLTQGFAQDLLFDTPARAAASQFAINHHRGKTADAMLRGTAGNLVLMHVMHHHLVFGACQPTDGFNGVLTDFATRAENFNFVLHESVLLTHSFC